MRNQRAMEIIEIGSMVLKVSGQERSCKACCLKDKEECSYVQCSQVYSVDGLRKNYEEIK